MLPTDAPGRPDVLLTLIGVALLTAVVGSFAAGLPFRVTAPVGSLFACVVMADGLLRNPPTDE